MQEQSKTGESETGETDFANAISLAAKAFLHIHGKLRRADSKELKPLLQYLASDRPLSRVDRLYLVDLLSGELGKSDGRPTRKIEENQRRESMYLRYKAIMQDFKTSGHPRPHQEPAIGMVAQEFNATHEQVRQIIRDPKMRETL